MLKPQLQKILTYSINQGTLAYNTVSKHLTKTKDLVKEHLSSWTRIIILVIGLIIFLYYPLGGFLIHNIDTSSTYQPDSKNHELAVVDMSAYLINREVYNKLWTPSLPFMFPSYFLDNMPNFQLGLMSAINQTISALSKTKLTASSEVAKQNLDTAATLLNYPGDIWLFSPQNHLIPAPSSATQYRKGRKSLKIFNRELEAGRAVFERSPHNLALILKAITQDLNNDMIKNENFLRENKDSYINLKTDDIFYFTQGKLYAYAQILKALSLDFKQTIIDKNIYEQWISAEKSLEQAAAMKPLIIRNGNPDSSFTPNHIITINYYTSRSFSKLENITLKLEK